MSLQIPLSKVLRTTKAHIKRLEDLQVRTVRDLLLFFPRTYEDKRTYTPIAEIRTDQVNNIKGKLSSVFHKRSKFGKALTKAIISDSSGSVEVIWFNQPYLQRVIVNGMKLVLSGKAKYAYGKTTLQNPTYEEIKEEQTHTGRIIPVYHQTEGISSKWIREKLKPLIDEWTTNLKEFLPDSLLSQYGLMDYANAVKEVHFPSDEKKLEQARFRLSFDELFLIQLKALQKKWLWQNIEHKDQKQISLHPDLKKFLKSLPFELTKAQKQTIQEILDDLNKPFPMSRLLQGDVGSGKTIVAGAAIFNTYRAGYQCAIMAPTEILAKQHYNTLYGLFKPYGLNIQFISGNTTSSQKKEIIRQLKTGTVDLIIGTHSLIQEGIGFKNLGLAVIDEQHRFGVAQRAIIKSYGSPHLLSLSATPIPRTLAMTIYGDQDLSIIDEMPKGRQTIITRIVPENKRIDAYRWIENQTLKSRQTFVICPLIDESDVLEIKSAIQEYERLKEQIFPNLKVGLLHGKMKPAEKESIMQDFKNNKINILVSTSVIEVGIDVPNATIMIIEDADRFGLSQLHQFRGRVGRGEHQSYCFLFPKGQSQQAGTRLKAMTDHTSGFRLSEIDLQLRGSGEIFGLRQSGIPDLKMASLTDSKTIGLARQAAQSIIDRDPLLENHPQLRKSLENLNEVYVKD
ncbi:ATP-dependent DNA helicase RecG [Patescibacteria group bacterium]|nr:ATP-dependent DNA helicase RecG [Patescibacteria group bacterium]MBU1953677.1 ATP-dependent DNA helicase RecG [Patescibacteria group bacterium]